MNRAHSRRRRRAASLVPAGAEVEGGALELTVLFDRPRARQDGELRLLRGFQLLSNPTSTSCRAERLILDARQDHRLAQDLEAPRVADGEVKSVVAYYPSISTKFQLTWCRSIYVGCRAYGRPTVRRSIPLRSGGNGTQRRSRMNQNDAPLQQATVVGMDERNQSISHAVPVMATVVGEASGTTSAGHNPVGVAQPVSGPPVCVQPVAASACVESNLDFESPTQTSGRRTAPVKFVFAQVQRCIQPHESERYCGVLSCCVATLLVLVGLLPLALCVPCCPCDRRRRAATTLGRL